MSRKPNKREGEEKTALTAKGKHNKPSSSSNSSNSSSSNVRHDSSTSSSASRDHTASPSPTPILLTGSSSPPIYATHQTTEVSDASSTHLVMASSSSGSEGALAAIGHAIRGGGGGGAARSGGLHMPSSLSITIPTTRTLQQQPKYAGDPKMPLRCAVQGQQSQRWRAGADTQEKGGAMNLRSDPFQLALLTLQVRSLYRLEQDVALSPLAV